MTGKLRFWCEYEPPTLATRLNDGDEAPAWVHTIEQWPTSPRLAGGTGAECGEVGSRQNTDPWIWSPGFVWTICRHHVRGRLRPIVRDLSVGDLVLLGSVGGGRWLLDTVLVVSSDIRAPEAPLVTRARHRGTLYANAVLDCLDDSSDEWRLIPGQPHPAGTEAFSFVPALPLSVGQSSFERPDLAGLFGALRKADGDAPAVNAAQAATRCRSEAGVAVFWSRVVELVRGQGLVLGTSFQFPVTPGT